MSANIQVGTACITQFIVKWNGQSWEPNMQTWWVLNGFPINNPYMTIQQMQPFPIQKVEPKLVNVDDKPAKNNAEKL
jgi:hypothetical protein